MWGFLAVWAVAIPAGLCPVFEYLPFWDRRVYELGVGPERIPQEPLTTDASSGDIRHRPAELGERGRAQLGVATAVVSIEKLVAS